MNTPANGPASEVDAPPASDAAGSRTIAIVCGAGWLMLSAHMAWLLANAVPKFEAIFKDLGIALPRSTELLISAARGASTAPGVVLVIAISVAPLAWALLARPRQLRLVTALCAALLILGFVLWTQAQRVLFEPLLRIIENIGSQV